MADLKISELSALAGGNLAAVDQLAIADSSASETKRITVTDLVGNATTLIADATIPGAKILFGAGDVGTTAIADGSVTDAKLAADSVTAAKIADEATVDLVTTLPGSGAFIGQIALDTTDNTGYIWNGGSWVSFKAAGSVNAVVGDTSGIVNLNVSTVGDQVTITTTLDNTTAARQFLAGPTGSGGTVGYRQIVSGDIPTASTSKGGVAVNGNGLTMSGDTIQIDNTVVAETTEHHLVQYDANGLVTGGRVINAGDIPVATNTTVGTVKPGSGLGVDGTGDLSHSNSVVAGTATKFTFDTEGHVTATESLLDTDIPDLDAAKITTGEFPTARIANAGITAEKLANYSTASIAELTPASGDFIGQTHLNSITGDYFLWDGNVWQPIGISVGEIVLAGTYDASTNLIDTVTSEGTALGFTVGQGLPAPSSANSGYYVIVSLAGTGSPPAPTVQLNPPDFLLSNGAVWTEIDVSDTVVAQQAQNVAFTPAGDIQSTNVQGAIEELDTEKAPIASPVFTGNVTLDTAGTLIFEGATDNAFETTLTVADPTADRTLTLPDVSGDIVTTGDTGTVSSTMIVDGTIVDADVSATADIAVDKLAPGTARQLLQTNVAGNGVQFTSNVDVPGTLDVTGATTLDSSLTVTGLISANGKISFPAGTAALPSIYFSTDTNTGLYQSAADEVSISTAGSQRVVVDAAGQVGIGTSNPGANLDIYASALPTLRLTDSAGGYGSFTYNESGTVSYLTIEADPGNTSVPATDMRFTVDGSEAMRIDAAGQVGIGTSSPSVQLEVAGPKNANQIRLNPNDGNVDLRLNSSYGNADLAALSVVGAYPLAFHTNNTERMRIDSAGLVGIGTSSPSSPLDVRATGVAALSKRVGLLNDVSSISNFSATDPVVYVNNTDTAAGSSAGIHLRANAADYSIRVLQEGDLLFEDDTSERIRITSAGLVGIGTSAPTQKLDLEDSTGARIAFTDTGTRRYSIGNAGTGSSSLTIRDESGSANRVTIDNSGNVGIGTDSPASLLHLASNAPYIDFEDIDNNQDWRIQATAWFAIRDQTANAERMRIDSAGNVGIGTDSPDAILHANAGAANVAGLFESTDGIAFIGIKDSNSTTTYGNKIVTVGDNLYFDTAGTGEKMRIDSAGNVGIGTSSPGSQLTVVSSAATGIRSHSPGTQATDTNKALKVTNGDDTETFNVSYKGRGYFAGSVGIGTSSPGRDLHIASSGGSIRLEDSDLTLHYSEIIQSGSALYIDTRADTNTGQTIFRQWNGTTQSEVMRLSAAGNLGIGTSSPSYPVHAVVTGGGTISGGFSSDQSSSYLNVAASGTTLGAVRYGATGDNAIFWAGSTERMRIDSAGLVGIGTSNPGASLETVVTSPGDAIHIYRADMTTNNRSVTFSAPATDSASEPFTWQTGNSFSWVVDATDALRINGAGSVGVNQPTPAATLDVNGAYASNITAVAALDLDLSTANYFTKTIAANSTFTFSSPAASRAVSFTLELTHTSGTVTWPTSVKWPGDVAPTLTTGKTHLFMFVTDDGGTTYRGASLVDYTN